LLNFRNQDYKFGGFRRRFKRETVWAAQSAAVCSVSAAWN
jgi:hypothetical protein